MGNALELKQKQPYDMRGPLQRVEKVVGFLSNVLLLFSVEENAIMKTTITLIASW